MRRPRPAQPQTDRCRYAERGQRCRRVATVEGQFCRQHAVALAADLEDPLSELLGSLDRALTGRIGRSQLGSAITGAFSGMFGQFLMQRMTPTIAAPPGPPPRPQAGQPPPPRPPPAPPPRDPVLEARELLGFEPGAKLTAEMVKDRKRALAKIFHPDTGAGSKAQMQRVLAAADLLLAKLS